MKSIILFGTLITITQIAVATPPPKLPNNSEFTINCAIEASNLYQLPTAILLAVGSKEGGSAGIRVRNNNGTYDVGFMQFNTSYIKTLHKYNINEHHLNQKNCYPFKLAAWRIKRHIKYDNGDTWTKVSNYHSRTPYYNSIYRSGVIKYAKQWQAWLDKTDLKHVKLVFKEELIPTPASQSNNMLQANYSSEIKSSVVSKKQNVKSQDVNNTNFSSNIDISHLNY